MATAKRQFGHYRSALQAVKYCRLCKVFESWIELQRRGSVVESGCLRWRSTCVDRRNETPAQETCVENYKHQISLLERQRFVQTGILGAVD